MCQSPEVCGLLFCSCLFVLVYLFLFICSCLFVLVYLFLFICSCLFVLVYLFLFIFIYRCFLLIPVAEAALGNCDVSISTRRPIALPRLTSLTCGSDASPWIMKVPTGQRINITLYQFSPSIPPDVADGSKPLGADTRETAGLHQTPSFGRIREPSASQALSSSPHTATGSLIVQGPLSVRESHVHTTQTNDVEVVLNGPNKHDFLLTFAGDILGISSGGTCVVC